MGWVAWGGGGGGGEKGVKINQEILARFTTKLSKTSPWQYIMVTALKFCVTMYVYSPIPKLEVGEAWERGH